MASIPIHNETDHELTEAMQAEIIRDAHEYFGSDVRLVRVQAGLKRHALNAKTREVRYAFSPQDFGIGVTLPHTPASPGQSAAVSTWTRRPRRRAAPIVVEESTEDETLEPHDRFLERLETGDDNETTEDMDDTLIHIHEHPVEDNA